MYFDTGWKGGNCRVAGAGQFFLNGSYLFDQRTGELGFDLSVSRRAAWDAHFVLAGDTAYTADEGSVYAYSLANVRMPSDVPDKLKRDYEYRQFEGRELERRQRGNRSTFRCW